MRLAEANKVHRALPAFRHPEIAAIRRLEGHVLNGCQLGAGYVEEVVGEPEAEDIGLVATIDDLAQECRDAGCALDCAFVRYFAHDGFSPRTSI
jgi:hypothetical protein